LGEYHILAVNADYVNRVYAFCADGPLLKDSTSGKTTFPFPSTTDTSLFYGALRTFLRPDTQQLHAASFRAHWDNFAETTFPRIDDSSVLSCN
jgi:hypothetical protein